jgi:photosystem II stability/assembly factor-like uncharacterized protein
VTGPGSAILISSDSGKSWRLLDTGSPDELLDAEFTADGRAGWAVGRNGAIVATANAGETWSLQPSGASDGRTAGRSVTKARFSQPATALRLGPNGARFPLARLGDGQSAPAREDGTMELEDTIMRCALIASAILLSAGLGARADAETAAAGPTLLDAKSCKCSWSQHNNDPNSGLWVCTVPRGCPQSKPASRSRRSVYPSLFR